MSFSTMAYQAGTGLYSLVKMCLLFFVSFLKFIFDSIFPPVIQVLSLAILNCRRKRRCLPPDGQATCSSCFSV